MPKIQTLSPHVADLIAAGEVVERPASVVKELIENAIDAGATTITVEISGGGMRYIRVTDNGCGIAREDAPTAFLRHATSKIRTEYDLEAIGTLGFRGEALAAIAAVSRVELITRMEDEPFGLAILLEGGVKQRSEDVGCPKGTTMIVRDLFFNTPARQKFVKRDVAESAAVMGVVQREALGHPEVSFRCIREGEEELLSPGDGKLRSALYAVLGREIAPGFLEVPPCGDEIKVDGFITRPACGRGSRAYQYFFVNGRYVKNRTMMAALEEAYKNTHLIGKFPGCVLNITARLSQVDVNVHPAKTEVKFTDDKRLFEAVYYAVRSALGTEADYVQARLPVVRQPKGQRVDTVTPNQTFFQTMSSQEFRARAEQGAMAVRADQSETPPPRAGNESLFSKGKLGYGTAASPRQMAMAPDGADIARRKREEAHRARVQEAWEELEKQRKAEIERKSASEPQEPAFGWRRPQEAPAKKVPPEVPPADREEKTLLPERQTHPSEEEGEQPAPTLETPDSPQWRMAGEVLNTYIIVEWGDKVFFIDKHAAHERMLFDKMKTQNYTPMRQLLLTPVVIRPDPAEGAVLLGHLELLAAFGFEAEDFGGGTILVREVPDYVGAEEVEQVLIQLAEQLLERGTADPSAARDHVLHTMACKAAIKGGWKNDPRELEVVARAVMAGEVKYCPHGRPVAVELTKYQLEKMFKRA